MKKGQKIKKNTFKRIIPKKITKKRLNEAMSMFGLVCGFDRAEYLSEQTLVS